MLKGKNILLGVSGSVSAYKAADLCSKLKHMEADVNVVMSRHAPEFVSPVTFDALSHHRTVTGSFEKEHTCKIDHIRLAEKADVFVVAPASADIIGKLANGLGDDALSSTALAVTCPKLLAPAMNSKMYENPAVQRNLKLLLEDGWEIIEPLEGKLACGAVGKGKLEEVSRILEYIEIAASNKKDLKGKKVLVTAGPTEEEIDPVRFITNHSTGKMGYEVAKAAVRRGGEVTLVTGPVNIETPVKTNVIKVRSADEMFAAVKERLDSTDIIIMTAAVADFKPAERNSSKIKKENGKEEIRLKGTEDILAYTGNHRNNNQIVCGFCMETEDLIKRAEEKRKRKKADLIVANSLFDKGAGFAVDTNVVTFITEQGNKKLPLMKKSEVAETLITEIAGIIKEKKEKEK